MGRLSAAEWDQHFRTLEEDGFVVIPSYFDGPQRAEMAAAQRRVLQTWEEVKEEPPEDRSQYVEFPCAEQVLNRAMVDHGLIDNIGKRWLGTDDVHIRVGVQCVDSPHPHATRTASGES